MDDGWGEPYDSEENGPTSAQTPRSVKVGAFALCALLVTLVIHTGRGGSSNPEVVIAADQPAIRVSDETVENSGDSQAAPVKVDGETFKSKSISSPAKPTGSTGADDVASSVPNRATTSLTPQLAPSPETAPPPAAPSKPIAARETKKSEKGKDSEPDASEDTSQDSSKNAQKNDKGHKGDKGDGEH